MYMNVTAFIMTIRVGANQSLMSGEIISRILQPSCCARSLSHPLDQNLIYNDEI